MHIVYFEYYVVNHGTKINKILKYLLQPYFTLNNFQFLEIAFRANLQTPQEIPFTS